MPGYGELSRKGRAPAATHPLPLREAAGSQRSSQDAGAPRLEVSPPAASLRESCSASAPPDIWAGARGRRALRSYPHQRSAHSPLAPAWACWSRSPVRQMPTGAGGGRRGLFEGRALCGPSFPEGTSSASPQPAACAKGIGCRTLLGNMPSGRHRRGSRSPLLLSAKKKALAHDMQGPLRVAGVEGFEPSLQAPKTRVLTIGRYPKVASGCLSPSAVSIVPKARRAGCDSFAHPPIRVRLGPKRA